MLRRLVGRMCIAVGLCLLLSAVGGSLEAPLSAWRNARESRHGRCHQVGVLPHEPESLLASAMHGQ